MATKSRENLYILCQTDPKNSVCIYDNKWNMSRLILGPGQELDKVYHPEAITRVPGGFLVCDWGNGRVCFFSLNVYFKKHVQTEEKVGLARSVGVSYSAGRVWLTQHDYDTFLTSGYSPPLTSYFFKKDNYFSYVECIIMFLFGLFITYYCYLMYEEMNQQVKQLLHL